MKTKLEMAHEIAVAMQSQEPITDMKLLSALAWQYADAMQAEADKREHKEPRETHKNLAEFNMHPEYDASINYPPDAWVMYKGEKRLAVSIDIKKEWQPDWSQAPESDVVAWDINKHGQARWITNDNGYYLAPSFGYTGDWRNSLRKRPE